MIHPRPGEVYWVDLGMKAKFRPVVVVYEPAVVERVRKQIAWMLEISTR